MIGQQLRDWPLARQNYAGLAGVEKRIFCVDGVRVEAQFNPGRIRSSAANTDPATIGKRPCFLCRNNRPPEQVAVDFRGRYEILVNPYPIFDCHLTIVACEHTPQLIAGRLPDLLDLAEALPAFTVFYNGPRCGASAPDHFHFQAGDKQVMPVEHELNAAAAGRKLLAQTASTQIYTPENAGPRKVLIFRSTDRVDLNACFGEVLSLLPRAETDAEPMMNILARFDDGYWQVLLFPRDKQRPCQFFAQGSDQILMSPASVEMGGLAILPRKEDFEKITAADLSDMYRQVTMNDQAFERLIQAIGEKTGANKR